MLASELSKYPWEALCMLARKLQVKMYLDEQTERNLWLVLGMLMEWDGQRRKVDESPKKVLAGIMMELAEIWKAERKQVKDKRSELLQPDFKKLARKLDLQGSSVKK